ncbi:MAG: hypothetical protein RXQ93_00010 [Caldisphaera sp.]
MSEEEVIKVAEKEGAIPFDVKGVGSRAIDSFNKYDINVITGTNDTINNLTEAILPDSQMVDRLWKEHEGFEHGKRINALILIYYKSMSKKALTFKEEMNCNT